MLNRYKKWKTDKYENERHDDSDEHYEKFVCNSIYDYLLLRFKAIAKRKKQEKFEANNAKRHANRKLSKI